MSETLASGTLAIARLVANVVDSVATGGSATTVSDTNFPFTTIALASPPDDHYNGGTIWMRSCANSGKTRVITDWVQSTGTFTFATMGLLNASGDYYSVCNRLYPRYVLRQAVNYVVAESGGIDKRDVSLVSVANQSEYDLPTGVFNVKKIRIAMSTTSPYDWEPVYGWREQDSHIRFVDGRELADDNCTLELTYRVPFTELSADSDTLPDLLDMTWLQWEGAAYCLRWHFPFESNPTIASQLSESIARAEKKARTYRPKLKQIMQDDEASIWVR